jgi:alanine racemase
MQNRGWMEVDLGALVNNARALMERAGVPIIPMIKADAYGLGATRVAAALESLDPAAYGVATVDEGIELRNAGIERAIIVFTPLLEADYPRAANARVIPTLGSAQAIARWAEVGGAYDLSIDTGMARAGIPWREIQQVAELIRGVPPRGAFTHFHSPALNDSSMDEQEERFAAAIALLHARPSQLHTDSSAAITRHGRSKWDAVRPGIFMYGVGSGEGSALEPENVVTVKAPIVETRWLEPGDTVSYDATWTATSRKRIATIALGYADGYPRNAGAGGIGVVGERVVRITGRVTMDMIMLDVTDTEAAEGDIVTMIGDGSSLDAPVDVASVAEIAGMSPYELLTGLRGRMTRIYTD